MKQLLVLSLLPALVLTPAGAVANPTDPVQSFSGTAEGAFSGRSWQPVVGTQRHFVTKLRHVETPVVFRLTGICGACETTILIDGLPADGVEGALDGEAFGAADRGSHSIQLAVKGEASLDGPWYFRLEQVA